MARIPLENWIKLLALMGLTVTWSLMAWAARPFGSEFQRHTGFFLFLVLTGLPYFLVATLAAYSRPFPLTRKITLFLGLVVVIGGMALYLLGDLQSLPRPAN